MKKFKYFDNCEICKAMREADEPGKSLNYEELRAAFARQEKENQNLGVEECVQNSRGRWNFTQLVSVNSFLF